LKQSLSYLKKIVRFSGIYAGINILNQAVSFFLLPILTRYLSPANYGILATFQATYILGESFVDMGSNAAVARGYFDEENPGSSFKQVLFNSIVIKLSLSLVLLVIMFIMRDWINAKFDFPLWLIMLIPMVIFASAFTDMILRLWIAQKKVYAYSYLGIGRTVVNVTLSLIFVIALGLNWKGRVWGIAITEISCMAFFWVFLVKKDLLEYRINPEIVRGILAFGIPLFVYGIGRWVIALIDRFFLNAMVSVSATGIYSVGYSIGAMSEFIAGGIGFAVMPLLFEKLKNPTMDQKVLIVKYTYLYVVFFFVITIGWIFLVPYFLKFFVGERFAGAVQYVPWVAFAYFANAIFRMASLYITYSKKTYYLTYAIIASAAINIALNYILIKANGPIGAAQSTLASYWVNMLLACVFMQRVYPMPWLAAIRPKQNIK